MTKTTHNKLMTDTSQTGSLQGKTVALTGATGFLGQYLLRSLLEQNANVVAVVRNPDKVPTLKQLPIELRKADLADAAALAKAFNSCDAVISNAAVIGTKAFQEMVAANIEGTENVFTAMQDAGVKRCIQISSAGVYKPTPRGTIMDESFPLRDNSDKVHMLSAYPISKAIAETKAWELSQNFQIDLSVARPFCIYGAFDNSTYTKWFKRIMRPPLSLFPTQLEIGLVYAGDIADGVCLMLNNDSSIGEAYNFSSIGLSPWLFADVWRQAGGFSPLFKLPIPVPVQIKMQSNKAMQQLGWQPRTTLQACQEIVTAERRGSHWPL